MELDFLLRFPVKPHVTSPVDFISNYAWGGICSLAAKEEFRNLDRDLVRRDVQMIILPLKQKVAIYCIHDHRLIFFMAGKSSKAMEKDY